MKYNLMGIVIENRKETAPEVQKILTEYGDIIRMRMGFHEDTENNEGFIILTLKDDDKQIEKFVDELKKINQVRVKNIGV